jgi:hypothetical protein
MVSRELPGRIDHRSLEGAADVAERTRRRASGNSTTIQARRTTYRGIEMRSRLEADYAAWMDRKGRRWSYEPQCFAGPEGQYLPDFCSPIHQADDPADDLGVVYIEVKPYRDDGEDPDEIDKVLRSMEIILLSEPDAFLELHFWSYGASAPLRKLYRVGDDGIWFDHWAEDYGIHHVWSGMGQWDAITKAAAERLRQAGGG